MSLSTLPNELLHLICTDLENEQRYRDIAALASTCKRCATFFQPVLFQTLVLQRSGTTHWMKDAIERRKSLIVDIIRLSPHLAAHVKSVILRSAFRDAWWMTNASMSSLLRLLFANCTITSFEITGDMQRGIDGTRFHTTVLQSLPASVSHLSLKHIACLSPKIFTQLRCVSSLTLWGVAWTAKPLKQLLKSVPPQRLSSQPRPTFFDYRRCGSLEDAETSDEVVHKYLALEHVQQAHFCTDEEEDTQIMMDTLKRASESLQDLSLEATGLASNLPPAMEFPTLSALLRLSIDAIWDGSAPVRIAPWVGCSFFLKALHVPMLEDLTIRFRYGGDRRIDFWLWLAGLEHWDSLDRNLCNLMRRRQSLRVHLEFWHWRNCAHIHWQPGEAFDARVLYAGVRKERSLGEVTLGLLTDVQLAKMLPLAWDASRVDTVWL